MFCKFCKSEIAEEAKICPACLNEQSRRWFFARRVGAICGLLAIIGTASAYITTTFHDFRKAVAWRDQIQVISFSLLRQSSFLNTGDGEILISHIRLKSADIRINKTVSLYQTVGPNKFCVINPSDEYEQYRTKHHPLVSSHFSSSEWQDLLKVWNKFGECIEDNYYYSQDPGFLMFSERLDQHINTFKADGIIYYTSGKTGKQLVHKFPVVGVFELSTDPDCVDRLRGIIPERLRSRFEKSL